MVKSNEIHKYQKFLIVGDSGRGKSTLAKSLSAKLNIKNYSTDEYFWKTKYTVPEDKQTSIDNISKIYSTNSWIVEGSTRSLIKEGLEKSDLIVHLIYPNLFSQFWTLFKRKLTRKEERWIDLLMLYKHLFLKRYKIGSQKDKAGLDEMLTPYSSKIYTLRNFKEINNFVDNL